MALLRDPIWSAIAATIAELALIAVQYFGLHMHGRPGTEPKRLIYRALTDSFMVGAPWALELAAVEEFTRSRFSENLLQWYPIALLPLLAGWAYLGWLRVRESRTVPIRRLRSELILMVPLTLIAAIIAYFWA